MPDRTIHRPRVVFSASAVQQAVACALTAIWEEDNLTDEDIGRVLGKSADQARKYRKAEAEMGTVAFAAAKREWNGRFTGPLDRLCTDSRPGKREDDKGASSALLKAALALSVALEDGEITPEDVRANRKTLEAARDALTSQLDKLRPGEVA